MCPVPDLGATASGNHFGIAVRTKSLQVWLGFGLFVVYEGVAQSSAPARPSGMPWLTDRLLQRLDVFNPIAQDLNLRCYNGGLRKCFVHVWGIGVQKG